MFTFQWPDRFIRWQMGRHTIRKNKYLSILSRCQSSLGDKRWFNVSTLQGSTTMGEVYRLLNEKGRSDVIAGPTNQFNLHFSQSGVTSTILLR
jgi:hypothetical protein